MHVDESARDEVQKQIEDEEQMVKIEACVRGPLNSGSILLIEKIYVDRKFKDLFMTDEPSLDIEELHETGGNNM